MLGDRAFYASPQSSRRSTRVRGGRIGGLGRQGKVRGAIYVKRRCVVAATLLAEFCPRRRQVQPISRRGGSARPHHGGKSAENTNTSNSAGHTLHRHICAAPSRARSSCLLLLSPARCSRAITRHPATGSPCSARALPRLRAHAGTHAAAHALTGPGERHSPARATSPNLQTTRLGCSAAARCGTVEGKARPLFVFAKPLLVD